MLIVLARILIPIQLSRSATVGNVVADCPAYHCHLPRRAISHSPPVAADLSESVCDRSALKNGNWLPLTDGNSDNYV